MPAPTKTKMKAVSPAEAMHSRDSVLFCQEIEALAKSMSYIDSIIHLCEKMQIEPEKAATYINPNIREAIRSEALRLHMIEPSARLPF